MDSRPNGGKRLTKYERTQVIGVRAEQLVHGAQAFVDVSTLPAGASPYDIAERELLEHRMPFIIERTLPDGKTERIRLAEQRGVLPRPT
jgi:DNA-directed RNA polymerase subunit K/omega